MCSRSDYPPYEDGTPNRCGVHTFVTTDVCGCAPMTDSRIAALATIFADEVVKHRSGLRDEFPLTEYRALRSALARHLIDAEDDKAEIERLRARVADLEEMVEWK